MPSSQPTSELWGTSCDNHSVQCECGRGYGLPHFMVCRRMCMSTCYKINSDVFIDCEITLPLHAPTYTTQKCLINTACSTFCHYSSFWNCSRSSKTNIVYKKWLKSCFISSCAHQCSQYFLQLEKNYEDLYETFLDVVSKNAHTKVDQLKRVFSIDSIKLQWDQHEYQCKQVFQVWKESTQSPTYRSLRSALDTYSVFCGRNPLVSVLWCPVDCAGLLTVWNPLLLVIFQLASPFPGRNLVSCSTERQGNG